MPRKRLLTILLSLAILILAPLLLFHFLQRQPSYPLASSISLKGISMDSPNDGWAVGVISGAPNNVLFHYHAGQWAIIKPLAEGTSTIPDTNTTLQSVSMVTSNNGWAIGNTNIPQGKPVQQGQTTSIRIQHAGLLLHYVNGKWETVKTYVEATFLQISMQSATSGWVIGEDYTTMKDALLLHYNGKQWTRMNLPETLVGTGPFTTLSALPSDHLWVTMLGIALLLRRQSLDATEKCLR